MARQIIVEFVGNTSNLNKSFNQAGQSANTMSTRISAAAALAGVGLATAGAAAIKFGLDSIQAASKLEQSAGAIESVFGDASGIIEEFGKTSAKSFGLSKREVNELGAVMGAQLQSMGFSATDAAKTVVTLEKRAADLAATFGGTTADAVRAISALLRGERDPIEKYGVSLKEADVNARIMALGLDTSTAAAKKEATAIASLDLLMQQTNKTQGQFAREADTLAGKQAIATASMEDAQAMLGQRLVPIMVEATDKAIQLIDGIVGLANAFEQVAEKAPGGSAAVDAFMFSLDPSKWLDINGHANAFLGIIDEMGVDTTEARRIWQGFGLDVVKETDAAAGGVKTFATAAFNSGMKVQQGTHFVREYGDEIANKLPASVDEGKQRATKIASGIPASIADAMRDKRTEWQKALDTLGEDLKNKMSRTKEMAKIEAALTGDKLKEGLASKDPVVRAQAQATANILNTRLRELRGEAAQESRQIAGGFATNLGSKAGDVGTNARKLTSAAKTVFRNTDGLKTYGRNHGIAFADGLRSSTSWIAQAARNALAAAKSILATHSPPGPESPLHHIDDWGASTAIAYADGFASQAGYLKAVIARYLSIGQTLMQEANTKLMNAGAKWYGRQAFEDGSVREAGWYQTVRDSINGFEFNRLVPSAPPTMSTGGSVGGGGGGGGVTIIVQGNIYGGPAGLDELSNEIAYRMRLAGA